MIETKIPREIFLSLRCLTSILEKEKIKNHRNINSIPIISPKLKVSLNKK